MTAAATAYANGRPPRRRGTTRGRPATPSPGPEHPRVGGDHPGHALGVYAEHGTPPAGTTGR
jgi:hypothetical protein